MKRDQSAFSHLGPLLRLKTYLGINSLVRGLVYRWYCWELVKGHKTLNSGTGSVSQIM